MLPIVPWGVDRSALHVGRREGDAVWHRRSDRRIPPRETVVKLSHHECAEQASTQGRPSRKSQVRELRADAVKVRRPRASGVGAKRRTLHGVEHSSTLTNVTAGQHTLGQKVAQILRVTRRRTCGEPGPDPPVERASDLA